MTDNYLLTFAATYYFEEAPLNESIFTIAVNIFYSEFNKSLPKLLTFILKDLNARTIFTHPTSGGS